MRQCSPRTASGCFAATSPTPSSSASGPRPSSTACCPMEHFTVDGTLIDAWASLKSFQRKDVPPTPPDDPGNPTVNFHGERRSNATHASTTDPQALLYRKGAGREAKLCYQGHVLMENRHGLAVDGCLTAANGYGERAAALEMIGPWAESRRVTVGADKAYDTRDFVEALRLLQVTPHVAQNTSNRSSAIDERTTRHAGYEVSQQTVSYTHLRAHETPEHLVCRLLLEKKNVRDS